MHRGAPANPWIRPTHVDAGHRIFPVSFPADEALLRDTMSPAAFEEMVHKLAEAFRSARRERDTLHGSGNRKLELEVEIARGEFVSAWWQPAREQIRKRA